MEKRLRRGWWMPLTVMAAACMALLTACGGPSPEELIRKDLQAQFATVNADDEAFVEAMETGASGGFDQLGIDPKEFATAYLDGFSYDIGEIDVDEQAGTATAAVTVQVKSLSQVVGDFQTALTDKLATMDATTVTSEDELYRMSGTLLLDAVKAAEPKEAACSFSYTRADDGAWAADDSAEQELMKAMM